MGGNLSYNQAQNYTYLGQKWSLLLRSPKEDQVCGLVVLKRSWPSAYKPGYSTPRSPGPRELQHSAMDTPVLTIYHYLCSLKTSYSTKWAAGLEATRFGLPSPNENNSLPLKTPAMAEGHYMNNTDSIQRLSWLFKGSFCWTWSLSALLNMANVRSAWKPSVWEHGMVTLSARWDSLRQHLQHCSGSTLSSLCSLMSYFIKAFYIHVVFW